MYAILDIETTGGKYNEEGITEIAIYKFDGQTVVDEFVTLVNPERPIQAFVVGLTGINNEMLRDAPKFHEVAKRIIEITDGCTIVAHNAQFDYRILSLEFDRLGYNFERTTLCTVELSQQLLPGHDSYSLGKLTKALGISMSNRHRADGDAIATVKLFELLLSKDPEQTVFKNATRSFPKKHMDTKLKELIKSVPSETGVYFMHNVNETIIYIGKSKNMKKRLTQHFTNDNRKSKKIQDEVEHITFVQTGSELVALLKENEAIKQYKPKYNRALRRTKFKVQLTHFTDEQGYIHLKTERADGRKESITTYSNTMSAKSNMERIIASYDLCMNKTQFNSKTGSCFNYGIEKCNGACVEKESPESYNKRVQQFIDKHSYKNKSMIITERGRKSNERSFIYIENGTFKGTGFYDRTVDIKNLDFLASVIEPMTDNRDAKHIIQSYCRSRKRLKVIALEQITNS
ncbi:exonuclease domain-containing protein [uncultured Dokdonia sp.]|uniref:exonuclease domain-containing protein n=1 Tax=uncultured Dokdonia sp. TaxID=575653 RepID=UPI0026170A39|nr:exonuclease domain-containing protein [uncultured Dokdonia sp.]